jgi:hypothetical protein
VHKGVKKYMSDVMPKMKIYILCSAIILIYNMGIWLMSCIANNTINLGYLALSSGGSFVPFVSLISTAISGIGEITPLLLIFTGILTGVQVFIVAMILLQIVHNLFWSPDV